MTEIIVIEDRKDLEKLFGKELFYLRKRTPNKRVYLVNGRIILDRYQNLDKYMYTYKDSKDGSNQVYRHSASFDSFKNFYFCEEKSPLKALLKFE